MIDLRSDTVTRPGRAMLEAMMAAPVGDDVYGDDPTVNELQRYAADLAGKEAALFLPTGTQANLVGLLSHCQRGEEYIVGQGAHNYLYEAGGAAVLGSIQPQPIDAAADGSLPLDKVAAKIKPDDIHFAPTRLLSLENTHNGKVLPRDYLQEAWRKMVGGGMRQAGILAAAGLYALKNNVQRLQEDHDNAAWMAEQLRAIGADVTRHDTNMLFVRVGEEQAPALGKFMQAQGVLINASPVVRLVTHLDVNRQQLSEVVAHWQAFLQR